MNEFPDKENIINLTKEELNDIYTLIDKTTIVELKNLCKKYGLKCSSIKVKELKIFLKEFFEEQHNGKFEFTENGLKVKKLPEIKKIMEEYGIAIDVKDKKDDFIKKIITHLKKSRSESKSKSSSSKQQGKIELTEKELKAKKLPEIKKIMQEYGIKIKVKDKKDDFIKKILAHLKKSSSKTKSPSSKQRISVQHKFKKNDRVYVDEIGRAYIKNYDYETNTYTIMADEIEYEMSDIKEDQIKHISSKSKTPEVQIKPPTIYSAETEYPEINPLNTGYSNETIPAYERDSDKMPELVPDSNEIPDDIEPEYERDSDKMPDLVPDSDEIPDTEPEYIEEKPTYGEIETEILEENRRINIEDIPEFLNVFQNRTIENIIDDDDVRITELIQKCLLMGIA